MARLFRKFICTLLTGAFIISGATLYSAADNLYLHRAIPNT